MILFLGTQTYGAVRLRFERASSYGRQTMKPFLCILALLFLAIAAPAVVSADTITYSTPLNAASESAVVASPAIGFAIVTINTMTQTIEVNVTFSGLTSGNTATLIHCCTATPGAGNASVASTTPTLFGFPSGETAGSYDQVFDLTAASTYNPAFVTAEGGLANAETALLAGLADGDAYLNIHTENFEGGEIRGFFLPEVAVGAPEPSSLGLFSIGLLALAVATKFKLSVS